MKIFLYGEHSENITDLIKSFTLPDGNPAFEIVTSNPDIMISYGGDGTMLSCEREYPGVPKLAIRDSKFCIKCSKHDDKTLLQALLDNKLKLKEFKKIQTNIEEKNLFALNDFVIRNEQAIHAIRFNVFIDNTQQGNLLIGDGIVVSTAFGSTGYFKSITGKSFDNGLAVAFNNLTEKRDPVYLNEDSIAEFKLVRGNAILTYDNNPETFQIPEDKTFNFQVSDQTAKFYEMETLRCTNCQIQR